MSQQATTKAAVRKDFRDYVYETYEKPVKDLSDQEIKDAIQEILSRNRNKFSEKEIKDFFQKEFTLIRKSSDDANDWIREVIADAHIEFQSDEVNMKPVDESEQPEQAPESEDAPQEDETDTLNEGEVAFIASKFIDQYHAKGKFFALPLEQRINAFIEEEDVTVGDQYDELVKEINRQIKEHDEGVTEKPAKEEAPEKGEEEEAEAEEAPKTAAEAWTKQIMKASTEGELREILNKMPEMFIFVKNRTGEQGIVTGTGTNKRKNNRPFLVITISGGKKSRPFSDLFTSYFTIEENSEKHQELKEELTESADK